MFRFFKSKTTSSKPLAATDFLQAEQEKLAQMKAEILTLNQTKNRFLSAVSHDLRQPFQAMGLFLHLLQNRLTTPEQQELAGKLQESLRAGEALLSSILEMVSLELGKIQPQTKVFPLQEVLESLVQEMEPEARAKGLRLSLVPSSLEVKSDPILLGKILRQLLRNAIAYTDKGRILLGCRRYKNLAKIMVCDTGTGIPQEKLPFIFEEFYQADNLHRDRTKGLGLGLAMVERIVRLLGPEKVTVSSIVGRGSVFCYAVPRNDQGIGVFDRTQEAAQLTGRLIALVEDDSLQLMALQSILNEWGCQTIAASRGDDLLQQLDLQKRRPDLVLTDFRLPGGITGLDVIEAVRTDFDVAIPGIILTGDAEAHVAKDLSAQRVTLLSKPIQPARLKKALDQVIG